MDIGIGGIDSYSIRRQHAKTAPHTAHITNIVAGLISFSRTFATITPEPPSSVQSITVSLFQFHNPC